MNRCLAVKEEERASLDIRGCTGTHFVREAGMRRGGASEQRGAWQEHGAKNAGITADRKDKSRAKNLSRRLER